MPEKRFRKGDLVKFRLTTSFMQGVVKEDRGPIGIKGRHLYLVEFGEYGEDPQADSPRHIELPAEDMEPLHDLSPQR